MPDLDQPDIDKVIHEPARFAILSNLMVVDSADFVYVQNQTKLTRGNLSSHMTKLETAGYISVEKKFVGKKPQTILSLTLKGRSALEAYVQNMKKLLGGVSL